MGPGITGMDGNYPRIPAEHVVGRPGRNGNGVFRPVPVFPVPMLAASPVPGQPLSESEIAGPSHRGAVGGTLSRSISIWEIES